MIAAWFGPNVPWHQKQFWTQRMELLGDVGHLESHFRPFRDSVSVGAIYVNGLCQTNHKLRNHLRQMNHKLKNRFGHTR
jgi:hypothetical protein